MFVTENIKCDFTYDIEKNVYFLEQPIVDKALPRILIFELNDQYVNTAIDEFKDMLYGCIISVLAHTKSILTNPLDMYAHLETPVKINNKIIMKLPFDYLLGQFILIAHQYHPINYKIIFNSKYRQFFSNISMGIELTYIKSMERVNCVLKSHNYLVQCIQSEIIDLNILNRESKMEFIQIVNFKDKTKGYFIQGNIDELVNVELYLNDHLRYSYDEIMIYEFCHRISKNLIYIPHIGQNMNYKNISNTDYDLGINQNLLEIKFKLKFSQPQFKFSIHSITLNSIKIMGGMMTLEIKSNYSHMMFVNSSYMNKKGKHVWMKLYKKIDSFELNESYCICNTCFCNCKYDLLIEYLEKNNKCPMCQNIWTNYVEYINQSVNPDKHNLIFRFDLI